MRKNGEIGARGGGGVVDLIATLLFFDVCVKPCIYATCFGWWYDRPYYYNDPRATTVVVTPGNTIITHTTEHTPSLENLTIKRD